MISVIVPSYNRLALLQITLANLFAQSRLPDEVIVVDDHSTDGTYHYLLHQCPYPVVALQTQGKGPGAARNTGLKAARGEFIKFFDSDDVMTRNSLETQRNTLLQTKADMVYSPYVHARWHDGAWHQADVVLQHRPIPPHRSLRQCMAYGFFAVIPSMLFRRSLLDKVGPWREDLVAYEDWDYLWRLAGHVAQPAHTAACLMLYRLHGAQTTEAHFDNHRRDHMKLACLHTAYQHCPSGRQRALLQAEIYKTKRTLGQGPTPLAYQLLLLYKRLRNKYERYQTHTPWERMHGPNADEGLFARYLEML